jgi:NAD(P)-dependent dehydrogenase (short-subunit alcohol dehydrogenase family)
VDDPVAVVCGSDSLVGAAVLARMHDAGWRTVAVDGPDAASNPIADVALQGPIWEERFWATTRERLAATGVQPDVFVHAQSGFDTIAGWSGLPAGEACDLTVRSADLGCRSLMPLMPDRGAIVLLASVLAGWDTRPETGLFGATQAGLLALTRSRALLGAAAGVRVNAVAIGFVAADADAAAAPPALWERIPLGQPAHPNDVADAVLFLLSPDARHITGSSLVVDGGQSLQSWSNAPRSGGYSPPPRGDKSPAPERFRDRSVLITGAAGGLGSAAAKRFADEGARLALLDRDGLAVTRLAEELAAQGTTALPLTADVTDEDSLAAAFSRAEEHFGRLNVIFNNAGVGGLDLAIANTPTERWDELLAVNLRGVFLGCKLGVLALQRAGGGAIVNMGSSTGRHDTITGGAAYMASKAAVEAMTKSLALQAARDGIRANTICPGIIETSLSFRQQERGDRETFFAEFAARIPLGRVGQPEDVAAAVAFLASDQARHITGASLLIDGGQTLRRWISAD